MDVKMSEEGREANDQEDSGDSTTDLRCPICLESFEDKAFIDPCFHAFCFSCIVQWSEVTNTCPMCKTAFNFIVHNVQIDSTYSKFEVKSKATSSTQEVSLNEARRFRYRTTGRYREVVRGRGSRRPRQTRKPAIEERRRAVYATGLQAVISNRQTRIRDITAKFYHDNPATTHRLLPWLSREFRVLLGEEHVDFMIQILLSLIDKVDLASDEFATHLEPFLHEKTRHFLHELVTFAKSPFDMIAYDNSVSYNWPEHLSHHRQLVDETTASATPGPSAEAMQQRILQELASTRWDDSPPLMPSDSPIVIHGSDSEDEESGSHHSTLSPVHAGSGMDIQDNVNGIQSEENAISNQQIANTSTSNNTSTFNQAPSASDAAAVHISSTTSEVRTGEAVCSDIEDEEICLFAEGSLIDQGASKDTKLSSGATHSDSRRKDCKKDCRRKNIRSTHDTRESIATKSGKSEEVDHKRHGSRHHSTSSRDRGRRSSRDQSSARDHRRHSHHHHSRHSSHMARSSQVGESTHKVSRIERDSDCDSLSDAYCRRETDRHRFRLYSDDITPQKRRQRLEDSRSSNTNHYSKRKSSECHSSGSCSSDGLSSHEDGTHVRSKVVVAASTQRHDPRSKQLVEELESVDEKLQDNKRQLLKTLLRRERIQLLHKSLHGEGLSEGRGEGSNSREESLDWRCSGGGVVGSSGNEKLEKELEFLDRAIATEKKQLLHVLMRIEEEQCESDSDQD